MQHASTFIRTPSGILVYKMQIWSTKICNSNFKAASCYLSPFVSIYWVKEERYHLHTIITGKSNWSCHILRRNCLLKHVIEGRTEGRVEVKERREGRPTQLLDDLKKTQGYWKFEGEAVDGALWRSRFIRGYEPAVKETTEWLHVYIYIRLSTYAIPHAGTNLYTLVRSPASPQQAPGQCTTPQLPCPTAKQARSVTQQPEANVHAQSLKDERHV